MKISDIGTENIKYVKLLDTVKNRQVLSNK